MIIDCDACVHSPARSTSSSAESACDDCVVSVLLGIRDDRSVVAHVDDEHAEAISVLAESGLVPPLRLVRAPRAS